MRFLEVPALITEDIEDPNIVDITEPITASISGTTLTIDGGDKVSGEVTITLTNDVTVSTVTTSNIKQPSIHKIIIKTNGAGNFTYVPNDGVTASSVSTTTKTGSDLDILLITTSGGDTYLDLDIADYVSPAANFSNVLTGFNITDLTSAYGTTAKLYKPDGTLLTTVNSPATGSGVNFGYTESSPGDVIYKLEVTDDVGRKSKYNLPRKWINYAMETTSTPGFQKFALSGNDYTSTVTLPSLGSSSKARIHKTTDHGYMGIKFRIQGRNSPSDDWVDVDDTGENENADESAEFLAFGNYTYQRVWVKPTAKATTTVSSSNVVTLTLSNVTEDVTTKTITGTDPFHVDETSNVFVFEEPTKIGSVPYSVTVGTETYTNAVTATTEEVSTVPNTDMTAAGPNMKHTIVSSWATLNTTVQASGDGKYIIYEDRTTAGKIQVMKGDPENGYTNYTTITYTQGIDSLVSAISYDGKYILFASWNNSSSVYEMHLNDESAGTYSKLSTTYSKLGNYRCYAPAFIPRSGNYDFVLTGSDNNATCYVRLYKHNTGTDTWTEKSLITDPTNKPTGDGNRGYKSKSFTSDGKYLMFGNMGSYGGYEMYTIDWDANTAVFSGANYSNNGNVGASGAVSFDGKYVIIFHTDSNSRKIFKNNDAGDWSSSTDVTTDFTFADTDNDQGHGFSFCGENSEFFVSGMNAGAIRMYSWYPKKEVTLAFTNPTLTLTGQNVTISSAKLYKDDVLFHTYGTESNVVLRSDQTGTYQAIVNDVYYSNRVTPDFTTTRSVSAPQLEFDGYNKLTIKTQHIVTEIDDEINFDTAQGGDWIDAYTKRYIYLSTDSSGDYIYWLWDTYTGDSSLAYTWKGVSGRRFSAVHQIKYSPSTREWLDEGSSNPTTLTKETINGVEYIALYNSSTLTAKFVNPYITTGGTSTSTTLGLPDGTTRDLTTQSNVYIYETGTYTANVQTSDTFAYLSNVATTQALPTRLQGSDISAMGTTNYTRYGVPSSQSIDVEDFLFNSSSNINPCIDFIHLTNSQDTFVFDLESVKTINKIRIYAGNTTPNWASRNTGSVVKLYNGSTLVYTSPSLTFSRSSPETYYGPYEEGKDYNTLLFTTGYTNIDKITVETLSTSAALGRVEVNDFTDAPAPSLTFDGFNKLAIENITQTSSTITYPNDSTVSTNAVSDVYIKDIGEYVLEASDANTFVTSNVEVGALDTVPAFTAAFHHGAFSASDYSSAYSTVGAAAAAGFVYSDTDTTISYTWGTLNSVDTSTSGQTGYTWTPPNDIEGADVLMVAGGGGGGDNQGGGGGAGGLVYNSSVSLSGSKTIVVGDGGEGGYGQGQTTYHKYGLDGRNTSFSGLDTAIGGGGGGGAGGDGRAGGSGGGADNGGPNSGGSGISGQGFAGGNQINGAGAAGGGGAGSVGETGTSSSGGDGGLGINYTSTFGTTYGDSGWFASGGGGGIRSDRGSPGTASQGGGTSGLGTGNVVTNAQSHTGGGGGGSGWPGDTTNKIGGDGGSGIVIIKKLGATNPPTLNFDGYNKLSIDNVSSGVGSPTSDHFTSYAGTAAGSGGWSTNISYKYGYTDANGEYVCNRWDISGGYTTGDHYQIKFDPSSGTWSDVGSSEPNLFSATASATPTTTLTGYPSRVYLWYNTGLNLSFDAPSWAGKPTVDTTYTIKKDGAAFVTTTSNTVYIRDTGTYTAEVKGSDAYVTEVSKVVSGDVTPNLSLSENIISINKFTTTNASEMFGHADAKNHAFSKDNSIFVTSSDTADGNSGNGKVFIYKRGSDGTYTLDTTLNAVTGGTNNFGHSLDINDTGTRLVISEPEISWTNGEGRIHVYDRASTSASWPSTPTTTLNTSTDTSTHKGFGYDLALSGDGNTIGTSTYGGANYSRAYIFEYSSSSWTETKTWWLGGSTNIGGSCDLSHDGTRFVIGAFGTSGTKWYSFHKTGSTWAASATEHTLVSSSRADVRISGNGNVVFVGTQSDASCEIWEYDSSWSRTTTLTQTTNFGGSMASNYAGTIFAIGESSYNSSQGRVFIYSKSGSTITLIKTLVNPDSGSSQWFGTTGGLEIDYYGRILAVNAAGYNSSKGKVELFANPVSPSITYDGKNKLTVGGTNYEDTSTVTYYSNTYNLGTAKTMYVKDIGDYVFKISGTDKYVESNVHVSSVDLAGATTKPISFDGYNKLTLISPGENAVSNVTYFSNTYDLGSASTFYIKDQGTYDLEMSGSNVFALSNTAVSTLSTELEWKENEDQILYSSDAAASDGFGGFGQVAISGNYAIVGAIGEDEGGSDAGAAYIFYKSGGTWTQQAKLLASDISANDTFGYASIYGDYAIVGSKKADSSEGAAYIFYRSGTSWTQQAKLSASSGMSDNDDRFGSYVSIYGDYAIIGAPNYHHNSSGDSGTAYIFIRSGTSWSQQQKLLASDLGAQDYFGRSVSISGDYAIIGAPLWDAGGSDTIEGAAYIFVRSGTSWSEQQKLTASDAAGNDNFGASVSISGDYAIVGAWPEDDGGADAGAVYIFIRSGTSWSQQAKLLASDAQASDNFGFSVSISGNTAVVGAYKEDAGGYNAGAAYIFERSGTTWTEVKKIVASDAQADDDFGTSVAIDGTNVIIGSPGEDTKGSNAGAAYIFSKGAKAVPSLTFDNYNKLTVSNFNSVSKEWPPSDGTYSSVTRTNSNKTTVWTISGASYGNGEYTAETDDTVWSSGSSLGYPDMAFNKSLSSPTSHSGFITLNTPQPVELRITLPTAIVLGSYKLQGRAQNDTSETPGTWTMEGSNDGTTWTVVDTQTAANPALDNSKTATYTVSGNTTAYNRYKLNITATNATGGGATIIGELYLYDQNPRTATLTDPNGSTYALGQTQDTIYIKDTGDYTLDVTNNDQKAIMVKTVGTIDNTVPESTIAYPVYKATSDSQPSSYYTAAASQNKRYDDGVVQMDFFNFYNGALSTQWTVFDGLTTTNHYNIQGIFTFQWKNNVVKKVTKMRIFGSAPSNGGTSFKTQIKTTSSSSFEDLNTYNRTTDYTNDTWNEFPINQEVNACRLDFTGFSYGSAYWHYVKEFEVVAIDDSIPPPPSLNFDNYNKLTVANVDSDATSNIDFFSNTYEMGSRKELFINDAGTYHANIYSSNTLALVKNYVNHLFPTTETQKIIESDRTNTYTGGTDDWFGIAVSISGDYAIVGSPYGDEDASNGNTLTSAGAAYIFKHNGTSWVEQQKIVPNVRESGFRFGWSVSISGDYVIVGTASTDGADAGEAYIFKRSGTTWTQEYKLVASDASGDDQFGTSVSISGDYAIVGASYEDLSGSDGAGAAYIFKRSGVTWTEETKVVASDRAGGDKFGKSVSISGDYAIVGSHNEDHDVTGGNVLSNAGSAYIFKRSAATSTWTQETKIVASDRAGGDNFGWSVSISGDYAIVGSVYEDHDVTGGNVLSNAGSAYVFKRSGTTWTQETKIVASDRAGSDYFGASVSISGDYAIVGSHYEDHDFSGANYMSAAGSAYIFKRSGTTWTQTSKISASDRGGSDYFGYSVSISGNRSIVGAYGHDYDLNGANFVSQTGACYLFERPAIGPKTFPGLFGFPLTSSIPSASNYSDVSTITQGAHCEINSGSLKATNSAQSANDRTLYFHTAADYDEFTVTFDFNLSEVGSEDGVFFSAEDTASNMRVELQKYGANTIRPQIQSTLNPTFTQTSGFSDWAKLTFMAFNKTSSRPGRVKIYIDDVLKLNQEATTWTTSDLKFKYFILLGGRPDGRWALPNARMKNFKFYNHTTLYETGPILTFDGYNKLTHPSSKRRLRRRVFRIGITSNSGKYKLLVEVTGPTSTMNITLFYNNGDKSYQYTCTTHRSLQNLFTTVTSSDWHMVSIQQRCNSTILGV